MARISSQKGTVGKFPLRRVTLVYFWIFFRSKNSKKMKLEEPAVDRKEFEEYTCTTKMLCFSFYPAKQELPKYVVPIFKYMVIFVSMLRREITLVASKWESR